MEVPLTPLKSGGMHVIFLLNVKDELLGLGCVYFGLSLSLG